MNRKWFLRSQPQHHRLKLEYANERLSLAGYAEKAGWLFTVVEHMQVA